jgi:hypothetical protein
MKKYRNHIFTKAGFSLLLILIAACGSKPKVIEATNNSAEQSGSTNIFTESNEQPAVSDEVSSSLPTDVHTIMVLEKLPTDRYMYLRVREGKEEYWIATGKKEFNVGGVYFYNDALLKTNFESKEYNRVFERLYLVSNVVDSNHGSGATAESSGNFTISDQGESESIKISELISNPSKYSGKTVRVSGKCVKVNANIMGRNWIHIEDGTQGNFDFVVTSHAQVMVGQSITMTGRVAVNKDFGSGYYYDIILEDGELLK